MFNRKEQNKPHWYPSYLNSYSNGGLEISIKNAYTLLKSCSLCPRKCKVNRLKNEKGFCKTGFNVRVYSYMVHHGEEPPISGTKGSGTIFFSGCNMTCIYCQNYKFSQEETGKEIDTQGLADIMMQLQNSGCHNINLVTPTHVLPQILKALSLAILKGLRIPIVYNTGGYELEGLIKLLYGIVDIYLPDMRYADNEVALKYSSAWEYPRYNQESIKEMYRQVGAAKFDKNGILIQGLIVRHLVLPTRISETEKIMKFIARNLSKEIYISLMSQYSPYYKANEFDGLNRRITVKEYRRAQAIMEKYGLHNGWTQESYGSQEYAGVNIKST